MVVPFFLAANLFPFDFISQKVLVNPNNLVTVWDILMKLYRNVYQVKMMCPHTITIIQLLFVYELWPFDFYTPANFVCGGYTVFTLSVRPCVRPCVRPSVTLCFLNIFKSHCWIFIKPCKHVHICKTNILNKKVRARVQFY